jgi:hypothetical protein
VPGIISFTTAGLLPTHQLAEEAESAGNWWSAALRYNALAMLALKQSGSFSGGAELKKKSFVAVEKSSAISANESTITTAAVCTQVAKDALTWTVILAILKGWNPDDFPIYLPRLKTLMASEGAMLNPISLTTSILMTEVYPNAQEGDPVGMATGVLKIIEVLSQTIANAEIGEDIQMQCQLIVHWWYAARFWTKCFARGSHA